MTRRRGRTALAAAVLVALAGAVAATAQPVDANALSPANPVVHWSAGPIAGSAAAGCTDSPVATCNDYTLHVDVPPSYWNGHDGGVQIRIDWTAPETELDLYVYDASGRDLGDEIYGGRQHQQVYLYRPTSGSYTVHVQAVVATAATFTGEARIVADDSQPADHAKGPMSFTTSAVDPQVVSIEPGVSLGPDADVYVNAPWALKNMSSLAWRSTDGGATFTALDQSAEGQPVPTRAPCLGALGGADSDLTVDRTGRAYFATLQPTAISVATTMDHGGTWSCHPVANSDPEDDRPWLAPAPTADGAGPGIDAYLSYINLISGQLPVGRDLKPSRIYVEVTRDGGETWTPVTSVAVADVPIPGRIFTSSTGALYQPYSGNEGVWLAISQDGGKTFSQHVVSQRPGDSTNNWVSGAVDAAGNVFVAWVDGGSYQTLLSRSLDGGATWSTPVRLTPPGTTAMLPAVTAGRAGDVAVAWYGARATGLPDYALADTDWNVWVARSVDSGAHRPRFVTMPVTSTPAHRGPVCSLDCVGDHSRLGDFLQLAIATDGALVVSYADNDRADAAADPPLSYLLVSRQSAGVGMQHPAAPPAEPAKDAPGALDITTFPSVDPSTDRLTLSIAGDVTGAVNDSPMAGTTDAYWLVLWSVAGHADYAVMHVASRGAAPEFYGGTEPTAVADTSGDGEAALSYPAEIPLTGSVSSAGGTATVTIDLSPFKLGGQLLHRVQAFSLVGTGPVEPGHLLVTVDSTPGVDATA